MERLSGFRERTKKPGVYAVLVLVAIKMISIRVRHSTARTGTARVSSRADNLYAEAREG